ncbi:MAG: hypothetical protein JOY98_06525 [Candidatus Eremiobacteraeota bacterium]|nr:hypothetical protein [Candidatus Eremiobacteraeota bacterium]
MTEAPLPSGTVTFLFTDIEGSTQRWDRDRAAMQEAVRRHDAILRAAIEGSNGRVFKTIGDAFCAVFARAEEGVAAAVGAQRELAKEDFSAVDGVRVRMALHTGTADEREGDYYGPTLNRVARLLSIGHGGQILITRVTADLLRGHLVPGVSAHDMGLHKLKDLSDAELVHQLLVEGLEQEFPPLRSSGATPNNLPAQVSSFVGRENESAAVTDLLHANRLVTLLGTGGIGKTRLSLHVAGEQLEAFPNGIWFVEFAPLSDAALVADAVLSAANLQPSPERSALETLLAHFRNESALLIFDNCEHLIAEIARVSDALLKGAAKLKILASSRELLGVPGEQAYRMPTLGPAEAMALFAERARTADQRFTLTQENEPAVAEICRRLDGIALAIELAAARVKLLSPKALLEKLNDRFRVLTGGSRTLLPRQQTLRALIDWSYDLLSEKERTLFRRLAIFSGGFTLELCATVCADEALDEFEVVDLLVALVDKSLVAPEIAGDETRYTLLESIREYAREKLAEAGEVEAMSRSHAIAYTDFVEGLETDFETMDERGWNASVKPDLENWRTALSWSSNRDRATCCRLVAALRQVWAKFALVEGMRWVHVALEGADDSEHLGRLCITQAHLAMNLTQYQEALSASRRALGALSSNDAMLRAYAEMFAGAAMGPLGDPGSGEAALQRALVVFRDLKAPRRIALALQYLAFSRLGSGDVGGALPLLTEALEIFRTIPGGERQAAHLALALGEAEFQSGNAEAALRFAREALVTDRVLSKEEGVVFDLCNIAAYLVALNRFDEAAEATGEALALAGEGGIDFAVLLALQHVAAIAALDATAYGAPEDVRRLGARVLGFVDRQFTEMGFRRYFTEQREYEAVRAALEETFGKERAAAEGAAGADWSKERTVSEASVVLSRAIFAAGQQ